MSTNLPVALNPEIKLKKHSSIIHYKGNLSSVEHRVLNIFYKCAYDTNNFSSERYYIRISDICKFLNWDSGKYDDIRNALLKLREAGFQWNIFEADTKNPDDWSQAGGTGFISSYNIDRKQGIISFSLSDVLRDLLKNPNIYALIDLRVQNKLKSKYDLILYEYFLEELYRSREKESITRWYSINDIRRMLNVSDDTYALPKKFIHHCIKEPISSINNNTDIEIEIIETMRTGKKIAAFKFKLKFKTEPAEVELKFDVEEEHDDMPEYDIVKELGLFFSNPDTVNKIIESVKNNHPKYYTEIIMANIEYAKKKDKKDSIQSYPAFLRTAIAEDYAGYVKKRELAIQKAQAEKEIAAQKKIDEERRKAEDLEYAEYEKLFDELAQEEKDKYNNACKLQNVLYEKLSPDLQKGLMVTEFIKSQKVRVGK